VPLNISAVTYYAYSIATPLRSRAKNAAPSVTADQPAVELFRAMFWKRYHVAVAYQRPESLCSLL
jgi:hypothetical protein